MFFCKIFYKSTLVNQLNGNLALSKDKLIQVKDSIYYKNSKDYISLYHSTSTMLLPFIVTTLTHVSDRNTCNEAHEPKNQSLKRTNSMISYILPKNNCYCFLSDGSTRTKVGLYVGWAYTNGSH